MLQVSEGQCGKCAHFGSGDQSPKLVQVRVSGQAPEDLVESCGHPSNQPVGLKVTAIASCAGFAPAKN